VGTGWGQGSDKAQYASLEIVQFKVRPGVGFPQDYMSKLQSDLINEISERKKFVQVFGSDNKPDQITGPSLRLEGEVIEFKAGNQAARYLVGFGAGKTKVKAHVRFIDIASDSVIFEADVDGKVIMGLLGGSSPGATRGLAKEVAAKASKRFFSN
jgi:hypothetical protein